MLGLVSIFNSLSCDVYLTLQAPQDIIEAFFIKFDENVVLNRYNIPTGHTTYGTTCVVGAGGATPFPTGDSLNQWIQQVCTLVSVFLHVKYIPLFIVQLREAIC